MGAANHVPDPDPRPAPWWVRLSRWLNGTRVCSVYDCIQLTEPDEVHCTTHIRAFRAELGDRRCAVPRCVDPRGDGDSLCFLHREAAVIDAVASTPGQWNAPRNRKHGHEPT
ncbi:hypothetical protein ACFOVU_28675 [Nocardiopsis sediminis]|uniref:Uncharacterized protein n=1 Tax=Nocardiopsis sediminis TaxID=1778267 RepID=A0ABV8FUS3_9ACTN